MNETVCDCGRPTRDECACVKLCAVCSQPLPEKAGRGRPRKVCRDEDSPTPGGCARWRHNEQRHMTLPPRPGVKRLRQSPYDWFRDGGFIIE